MPQPAVSLLSRWIHRPQTIWLRRALFQIHLWSGIGVGLYVLMISVTGSVLVYRNELYRTFSPRPVLVEGTGTPLSVDELKAAALRAYPNYEIDEVRPGDTPNHAVEFTLSRDDQRVRRILHPFTGADLGNPIPVGYRFTAWLLDLHDNLLAGDTGRRVNGYGAILLLVLCVSGAIIWWPGVSAWRRSLWLDWRANWKRLNWSLHSVSGFWFFAFVLLWAITGAYLSLPDVFNTIFDGIEPFDENNPDERVVDRIAYWLAYLHFGRLGGRGIPWCGRGLCDSTTKAIWATAGMVLPLMFVTGAIMWWNRVVSPALRRSRALSDATPVGARADRD